MHIHITESTEYGRQHGASAVMFGDSGDNSALVFLPKKLSCSEQITYNVQVCQ